MDPILAALMILAPAFAFIGAKRGFDYYTDKMYAIKKRESEIRLKLEKEKLQKELEQIVCPNCGHVFNNSFTNESSINTTLNNVDKYQTNQNEGNIDNDDTNDNGGGD